LIDEELWQCLSLKYAGVNKRLVASKMWREALAQKNAQKHPAKQDMLLTKILICSRRFLMRNYNANDLQNIAKTIGDNQTADPMTVAQWCDEFNKLMQAEKYAALAIFGYSLPHPSNMIGCPLGDPEFERLGLLIASDCNAFAAAEKTGLIAEGVDAIFSSALDNDGSWTYHYDNIKYILANEELRKYVSFTDRYTAEHLIAAGDILLEDEDFWYDYARAIQKKLRERVLRGY